MVKPEKPFLLKENISRITQDTKPDVFVQGPPYRKDRKQSPNQSIYYISNYIGLVIFKSHYGGHVLVGL